eukprot:TRINITY_DN248_c2_g1_i2.p1 TRINITY_DN248_c2_g1~~TRINITY_DN248_c2_g1_i2.p1  ORF type:complete len:639 (+),score=234.84 TRINITY_DN248_c2_g1_i2:99-2015(+)
MIFWIVLALVVVAAVVWYTRAPPPTPVIRPIQSIRPIASDGAVRAKKKKKKKVEGPPMKILFGSQTGTAEEFAGTLMEEAQMYGFDATVVDMDAYFADGPEQLGEEKGVVALVLATYGEGEPPDNAKDMTDWISAEHREEGSMSALKYIVFGLGNRTYPDFNALARLYDKRLQELGATRIHERGEGDDECSLEEDFEKWRSSLWAPLCAEFNVVAVATPPKQKAAAYTLQYVDEKEKLSDHITWRKGPIAKNVVDAKNPIWCDVAINRELHGDGSDRSCRHVEVLLPDTIQYEAGDHLGVYAPNSDHVVEEAAELLQEDLERVFKLRDENKRVVLGPMKVRRALQYFVELTAVPRKAFLSHLVPYTSEASELQRLNDAISSQDRYNEWIKTPGRTVLEVLRELPSCHVPFHFFLEICPSMNPRYYSISSSPHIAEGSAHLTAVVVEFESATGRLHRGVSTTHLARTQPGQRLPVFVRKSTFRLPRDPLLPVIMIGPGTGVAPFRGFIQERKAMLDRGKNLGPAILFYGCRKRTDYLYREELEQAVTDGALTELCVAFSREQEKKVYVQHQVLEKADVLWEYLQTGSVYVCGDARSMAKDVHRALRSVVMEKSGKDQTEAESFMTKLQTSGRYHQDVWS